MCEFANGKWIFSVDSHVLDKCFIKNNFSHSPENLNFYSVLFCWKILMGILCKVANSKGIVNTIANTFVEQLFPLYMNIYFAISYSEHDSRGNGK